jgi:thymidylate synthase ThyX
MRKIIVSHELPPEANAMALAMYSRDPQSFDSHLEIVKKVGPEKFMAQYYVGYGHKSIGDCGSTTICAENVSMLCAKAIQHWQLYNGQEASTRYIDMSKQEIINPELLNPLQTEVGKKIQDDWMKIYHRLLEVLPPHLKEKFPMDEGGNPKVYERAINAKAFDIARSLLPAGATTYVGWHTNLRQAVDHITELRNHPLKEVREVGEEMSASLHEKYPSSGFDKRYEGTEKYIRENLEKFSYMEPQVSSTDFNSTNTFNLKDLERFSDILSNRPVKTELPGFLKKFGTITFTFLLDFGSFRDLQRHRSGNILMPPLTTKYRFHNWYLEQIPEPYRKEVLDVIESQTQKINSLECDTATRQYYVAMGFNVLCSTTFDLPAATYVAELRSGQTVHPTLRVIAQDMGKALQHIFPAMKLYCDFEPDQWSAKRGTQTIEKKTS